MILKLKMNGQTHELSLRALRPTLVVELNGRAHTLSELGNTGSASRIEVDAHPITYRQARDGNTVHLHMQGQIWTVDFVDPRDGSQTEAAGSDEVRAPMPGAVINVEKQPGDTVSLGDTIMVIESMKLQTNLAAPRNGVLGAVLKASGDTFDKDEIVATMETEDA